MVYIICFGIAFVLAHTIYRPDFRNVEIVNEYKTNGRPYIICPNHLSALDPIFIVVARGTGKKLIIMAKDSLFKTPLTNWFFTKLGAIPVARGTGDKEVLEKAIDGIRKGTGALIFPEGTRGNGNEMLKLKNGAFFVAAQTGADIIPARVIYHTKTGMMKLFCKVTIVFGEPLKIQDTQLDNGQRAQLRTAKAMLEQSLEQLLEENK